jgi:hypothetical protein
MPAHAADLQERIFDRIVLVVSSNLCYAPSQFILERY